MLFMKIDVFSERIAPRISRIFFACAAAMVCVCAPAGAQTVSIINHGAGTSSNFFVGDGWEIDLTGTPHAEIFINGLDTGWAIGSDGTRTFSGTIEEGSEGNNDQYWAVGTNAASPYPLSFTVQAAP